MTSPTPRDSAQPLRDLTDDEKQLLHYNPNTSDLVEFVQAYAREALRAQAERLQAGGGEVADLMVVPSGHGRQLSELLDDVGHCARWERDELASAKSAVFKTVEGIVERAVRAKACTCPSGDGSLRWPCPQHPAPSPAPVAQEARQMAAPAMVPLTDEQIINCARSPYGKSQNDYLAECGQRAIAEFCRTNGLTVGIQASGRAGK